MRTCRLALLPALLAVCSAGVARAAAPAQRCEVAAAKAVHSCVTKVAGEVRKCYLDTGAACPAGNPKVTRVLAKLDKTVLSKCPDAAAVQAAGYGALLTPAALAARLRETCTGEPATLAARTFGGPHAALLASADAQTRDCLGVAYKEADKFLKSAFSQHAACIKKAHAGKSCDVAKTAAKVGAAETKLLAKLEDACPAPLLKDVTGLDGAAFASRARDQLGCMTATGHGDTGPLAIECGPRSSVPVPPRGTWVQVVLPLVPGGPRCGKGAPYAFWLRLAPAGASLERVITDMAGGGVCLGAADCAAIPASLWSATDDGQPGGGYMSTNPAVNPFSDWTMLYMPYCTQDVHIGGGLAAVFSPTLTVERYGAVNVRAALRYLRDVLWAAMDDTDPEGWRPDRLRVLFGGESAGGFGVMYNYHYPLDDLRWSHTTALPDSGLALDNGDVGVRVLGSVISSDVPPGGWGTRPYQPPYCLAPDCAVGPVLEAATSVRLKAVPEQQILNLSNQNDGVQVSTTLFANLRAWVNALRAAYCTNQGKTGLRFFHPAVNSSIHTMLRSDARYSGLVAGGFSVRDFLAAAVADPDGVIDRVDEGTFVTDIPGVLPFTCLGGSPSGAFLDPDPRRRLGSAGEASMQRSVNEANAVPRPAKPARQT
jgi:hypothetical protein